MSGNGGGKPKRPTFSVRSIRRVKFLGTPIRGFKDVALVNHAQDQMEIRGITEDDVLRTLRKLTRKGLPTQAGRKRYRKNKSRYTAIDVVFEEKGDYIVVITAIKTRPRRPR